MKIIQKFSLLHRVKRIENNTYGERLIWHDETKKTNNRMTYEEYKIKWKSIPNPLTEITDNVTCNIHGVIYEYVSKFKNGKAHGSTYNNSRQQVVPAITKEFFSKHRLYGEMLKFVNSNN